jgi:hypothetical protein
MPMLYFRSPDNSYRYFATEHNGFAYIRGIWMDGIKEAHSVVHKPEGLESGFKGACQRAYREAFDFKSIDRSFGEYHPRIWGGPWSPVDKLCSLTDETRSIVATSVVVSRLRDVFRFVEPDARNDGAFSHEIRSVLLLAAMEVEASLAAVLRANGYSGDRWTIKDYVKLKDPLVLAGYQVKLLSYPEYPPLQPFTGWEENRAAQSLPWWMAYNSTKHDRDSAFAEATFAHALQAVAAAVVLLIAQFGSLKGRQNAGSLIASEFEVGRSETFPNEFPPEFFYVPRPDLYNEWTAQPLFRR